MSLLAVAVCVFLVSYRSSSDAPSLLALALLTLASLLAERQSVRLVPSIEISVAFFPVLFTAVLYGGFWAGLVGGAGLLLRFGKPYLRWTSWLSTRIIVASVAGDVAQLSRFSDSLSLGSLTLSAVAAVVAYTILDTVFAATTLKVRRTTNVVGLIKIAVLIDVVSVLLYSPIIAILAYAFLEAPRWTLVLFVAPAFATQRLFISYREQRETAERLSDAIAQLERVNLSFATALVTALDARDHYTAGHSAAVAVYARDIARKLNFSEDEQGRAHVCGLLHDIGKIGVPTDVLEKNGPLDYDERLAVEAHAEIGASILGRIEGYEEIALAVRHHHERYNGVGYPDECRGEEIPILARLVAVADAYSAMTSERPYRTALASAEAQNRIKREAGKQFDRDVVRAFLSLLDQASEAYVSGTDSNFAIEIGEVIALEGEMSLAVHR